MNRISRQAQRGFTLVEALVVLAIIALIAVLTMTTFDGSKSKAQSLVSFMGQTAQATQQFRLDTGVYPKKLAGLLDQAKAESISDKPAKEAVAKMWARPYIAMQPVDASDNFLFEKAGAGVSVEIKVLAGLTAGSKIYYIQANGVPEDVVKNALRECNGADADKPIDAAASYAGAAGNKCAGVAADNTFTMAFDQTK